MKINITIRLLSVFLTLIFFSLSLKTLAQSSLSSRFEFQQNAKYEAQGGIVYIIGPINSAKLVLSLENEPDSITEVVSFTIEITNKVKESIHHTLSEGKITIDPYDLPHFSVSQDVDSIFFRIAYKTGVCNSEGIVEETEHNASGLRRLRVLAEAKSDVSLAEQDFHLLPGQHVNITSSHEGGYEDDAQWSIVWKDGDTEISRGALEFTASNVQTPTVHNISMTITNTTPNNKVWYSHTYNYTITEYPSTGVTARTDKRYVLTSNDQQRLSVSASGGNPDGWEYAWSEGGSVLKENKDESFLDYQPKDIKTPTTKIVSVVLRNVATDYSTELYRDTLYFTLSIYPMPIDNTTTDFNLFVKSDTVITFEASTSGGNPEGWEYSWKVDGYEKNTDQIFNYDVVYRDYGKYQDTHVITLSAANYASEVDGKQELYSKNDYSYNVTVYPRPYYKVINGMQEIEVHENGYTAQLDTIEMYVGETVEFSFTTHDGFPNGWTQEWRCLGKTLGNQSTLQYKAETEGTFNIYAHITNTVTQPDDSQNVWFYRVQKYPIIVHPRPIAYFADTHASNDSLNVLTGDSITLTVVQDNIDYSQLKYTWYKNGIKVMTSDTYKYLAELESASEARQDVIKCVVVGSLVNNPSQKVTLTLERKISVWPLPNVAIDSKGNIEQHIETCGGRPMDLSVLHSGGQNDGWSVKWYHGDALLDESEFNLTQLPENPTNSSVRTDTYRVVVTNTVEKVVRLEKEMTFIVDVWPKPEAQLVQEEFIQYYGDSITLTLQATGGYLGADSTWTYTWLFQPLGTAQNPVFVSKKPSINVKVSNPDNGDSNCTYNYYVWVSNKYSDGSLWYRKQHHVVVHAYSRGKIDAVALEKDSVNIYSGHVVKLAAKYMGGYSSGWTFEWTDNGKPMENTNSNPLYITFRPVNISNRNKEAELHTYEVHCVNKIDDNIGCDTTIVYERQIWPIAEFSDDITLRDSNRGVNNPISIREGNRLTLHSDSAKYGYWPSRGDNWLYHWTDKDGKTLFVDNTEGEVTIPIIHPGENYQATKELRYHLNIKNVGPNKSSWASRNYSKSIKVYTRPKTPKKLQMKGNGTSGTFVVTMENFRDTDLKYYQYYLIFGYTDNAGQHHDVHSIKQENDGEIRWAMNGEIPSQYVNNAYVYTLWKYPDGEEITSGMRFMRNDKLDDDWDGSTYDRSTRAVLLDEVYVPTAIETATSDMDITPVNGVYNAMGQKQTGIKTGQINIVVGKDGSSKKVLIK